MEFISSMIEGVMMICNSFPDYDYVDGKNMFRGEDVGRGGYVYAEPGIYHNVVCLDISGCHPASILAMNCFGDYTKHFSEIVEARTLIKHKEYDKAKKVLDGKLAPYLNDPNDAKAVANALKTCVNSCYVLPVPVLKIHFVI